MSKKVLVIGWDVFKNGFDLIFRPESENRFIGKSGFWKKLGTSRRIKFCREFDVIHYFWGLNNFWEIFFLRLLRKDVIIHFIGSDVLEILRNKRKRIEMKILGYLGVKFYCVSDNLKNELKTVNISAETVPFLNFRITDHSEPLPEQFSVIAYIPENKENFYNADIILNAAELLPEIKFTIFPNSKDFNLKNVTSVPNIEHRKIFDEFNKHNLFIRITEHDGFPNTISEALTCARQVVWSEKHKFCYQASTTDELINIIRELKKNPSLNEAGKKFVLDRYNSNVLKEQYYKLWR